MDKSATTDPMPCMRLLSEPIRVVNIGLESFAENLRQVDVPVVQLDWAPPAGGDPELADLVSKLGA